MNEQAQLDDVRVEWLPGKEHRFTQKLTQKSSAVSLSARVTENDPQVEGRTAPEFEPLEPAARATAEQLNELLRRVERTLSDERAAQSVLLRGFSGLPEIPTFEERYRLRAASIAIYPMYRGVASLVGMTPLEPGRELEDQIQVVKDHYDQFDFFFIHTKATDQAGHNGDFEAKVAALEAIDRTIPALLSIGSEVTMITGDHSTPCRLKEHSWHPVPVMVHSDAALPSADSFSERAVMSGDLGLTPGPSLMTLALAHANRLDKFGA